MVTINNDSHKRLNVQHVIQILTAAYIHAHAAAAAAAADHDDDDIRPVSHCMCSSTVLIKRSCSK